MSDEKIADTLGISNDLVPYEEKPIVNIDTKETGSHETDDYNLARSTLRTSIENGAVALGELLTVARSSQKARDYEVAATIIKTLADVTKTLKDMHDKPIEKRINNLDAENQQGTQTVNIDKAVFVGTTAQLLKELKKTMKEEENNGTE